MKILLLISMMLVLQSCMKENITIHGLGIDSLEITEDITGNEGMNGFSIYANFDAYDYSNIETIYIIGYYPEEILEHYPFPTTFRYELSNQNHYESKECIANYFSVDFSEKDINNIITLLEEIKVDLYVNDKLVDTKKVKLSEF